MKNHFHTIIIGAGPGGLSCAAELARQGVDVLLLERNKSIGPKVCAGGVTWSGLARHLPPQLVEKGFCRQHVRSARQKTVVSSPDPIISTVNRENLGLWMAEEATRAGATILTETGVTSISGRDVATGAGPFTYQYLVGADGSNSLVRRFLKIPTSRIGAGVHYHVPGNFDEMIWQLDPALFSTGYAWIFPHRNRASVGAYACRTDISPRILQENLHAWMQKHGIQRKGLKAEAATINFDFRGYRFGNIFLVGDAAGLASGLTGEGIYPAICSGRTVAAKIVDPGADDNGLKRLIKKHQAHTRLLDICGKNRFITKYMLELLVTALRLRLLHFNALEMGE
ncbi:MAG: NAD(P)/FAD-dependent oxidoreductase [Pseudomonadota bacterium]